MTFEEWWKAEGDFVKWKTEPFKTIARAAWNAAKEDGYCSCDIDYSDGTAYCQNCGLKVKEEKEEG